VLPPNDDGSTGLVDITSAFPDGLNFFGANFSSLYVNNNGNVTFESSLSTYTPFGLLTTQTPMIAPFFGDVDTRGEGSDVVRYGTTTFQGRPAFCVMWANVGVGYYSGGTDKLNQFQLLLVNRYDAGPGDFDIVFNYDQVQWEAGGASGGSGGLGGSPARAGYSNGADRALELPGSGDTGAFLDSNTVTGLIHDQSGQGVSGDVQLGRYVFPVRNGEELSSGTITGVVSTGDPAAPVGDATVSACGGDDPETAATEQVCQVSQTNPGGRYVLPALPPGNYVVRVSPPGNLIPQEAGVSVPGSTVTQDFDLAGPVVPPEGITVGTGSTSSGTPVVIIGRPFDVVVPCAGGSGTVQFVQGGDVLSVTHGASQTQTVALAQDGTGHLLATGIVLHTVGIAQVQLTLTGCDNDGTSIFDIYIDPSGRILDQYGRPVAGASVTLMRSDAEAGPFTAVPDGSTIMSPDNRVNPMLSGPDGHYGWLTVPGFYVLRVSPPANCAVPGGGAYLESGVYPVPPEQTGIDLVLQCSDTLALAPATATSVAGTAQAVTAAVSRGGGAVTTGNVLFTVAGANPTTGTVPVSGAGQAVFGYTGVNPGTDNISACYDRNGNSSCDPGEAAGAVTRTLTAANTLSCNGLPATVVSNASTVNGTAGVDVIVGGPASQVIYGNGGNDVICGAGGNDVVNGGDGSDFLSGEGGMDMVIGGPGNDIERGGDLADKVGGGANDPGNDQLFGDGGNDQCFGALSLDVFNATCELRG
jgi:hypothetical protein